jgi:hypothetical protein
MRSLLASLSTDMNLGFWYETHVWNTTRQLMGDDAYFTRWGWLSPWKTPAITAGST